MVEADQAPADYWRRREEIAALATGDSPVAIDYTDVEHGVWSTVADKLGPLWERHACAEVLEAKHRLGLPTDRVPQLAEVDATLRPITGFGYRAVAGIVPADEFFAALAARSFPSTQYVRWEGAPFYTPEPDVIHEVMGHGNCLACPEIAELHRMAGEAATRVTTDEARQLIANVFWFTVEFGVVRQGSSVRAYGAGLLSSPGELDWFGDHADIRPLDPTEMTRTAYDIHHYQPVLFAGDSLAHVLDEVGSFWAGITDESAARVLTAPR